MCVEGRNGLMKQEPVSLPLYSLVEFEITGDRVAVLWKQQEVLGWSSGREQAKGLILFPQPRTADLGVKIATGGYVERELLLARMASSCTQKPSKFLPNFCF